MAIKGPASVRIIAVASEPRLLGRPSPKERRGLPSFSRCRRPAPGAAPANRPIPRRTGGPGRRAETPTASLPKPGPHAPVLLPGCRQGVRFSFWVLVIHYKSIVIRRRAIIKVAMEKPLPEPNLLLPCPRRRIVDRINH